VYGWVRARICVFEQYIYYNNNILLLRYYHFTPGNTFLLRSNAKTQIHKRGYDFSFLI